MIILSSTHHLELFYKLTKILTLEIIIFLLKSWAIQKLLFPSNISKVDTFQDFLIKLGIKPCMHLWEISIFSLNNLIVRPSKIMNRAYKKWANFQKTKYFQSQSFQNISFIKVVVGFFVYLSNLIQGQRILQLSFVNKGDCNLPFNSAQPLRKALLKS